MLYNLTPSRELTQPLCESSPWGGWISEQPTLVLNAVLSYVFAGPYFIWWMAESTPSQVELGAVIEPRTSCMTVHCSTNWVILADIISTEKEPISDDKFLWPDVLPDERLYKITAELSNKEWEDLMDTNEPPATLLQPPDVGMIHKLLGKKFT